MKFVFDACKCMHVCTCVIVALLHGYTNIEHQDKVGVTMGCKQIQYIYIMYVTCIPQIESFRYMQPYSQALAPTA